MNIRLILGILGGVVAVEFIAIIIQLRIYKREGVRKTNGTE